jgi:hypothetical protein
MPRFGVVIQAPIFISHNWEQKFHVHIDASQLIVRAILDQNLTCETNKPFMYS